MNRLRDSMKDIRASEELKQSTLLYLNGQRNRENKKRIFRKQYVVMRYAVAVMCFFLLAGAGGYSMYGRAISYISIDVNPSIELGINRLGRVVSVKGYNEDGQDILQHVSLKYISYMQAIDRLLEDESYGAYLTEDSQLVFTVISDRSDEIMEAINADRHVEGYRVLTYSSDLSCMEQAHAHEMSFGKYRAYQELAAYDAEVTVEDCHGMTMGEIQERIETCRRHGATDKAEEHTGGGRSRGSHGRHHGGE
ncbi:hypothetical protein V1224_02690 [Lachnospiraceae bacterium JLR.KK008]